jgi:hypothetical protein
MRSMVSHNKGRDGAGNESTGSDHSPTEPMKFVCWFLNFAFYSPR